jgi:multiple sugar transport system permease protein
MNPPPAVISEPTPSPFPRVGPFKPRSMQSRDRAFAILCFAPCAILTSALVLYPFTYTVWLSFRRKQLFDQGLGSFIGLDNYIALIVSSEFWHSLLNGTVFAVGSITLQVVIGVLLALLLNQNFPARGLFRGVLLFPYLVPSVVGIIVIRWMLNDLYGIVNYWLQAIGFVSAPVPWLGTPTLAMASLIAINTWMFYPFVMLCVLARLQSIPPDLYEAAHIDGAGPIAQFRYVTLPQIRGTLTVVILVRTLWMFNKFDTVWLTTQGGPFGSTQTLPVLAYVEAFSLYEVGRGAAVGILLCVFLLAFFLAYQRLVLRQREWQ